MPRIYKDIIILRKHLIYYAKAQTAKVWYSDIFYVFSNLESVSYRYHRMISIYSFHIIFWKCNLQ